MQITILLEYLLTVDNTADTECSIALFYFARVIETVVVNDLTFNSCEWFQLSVVIFMMYFLHQDFDPILY